MVKLQFAAYLYVITYLLAFGKAACYGQHYTPLYLPKYLLIQ